MKVLRLNNVNFKSAVTSTPERFTPIETKQQTDRIYTNTPDFNITTPVNYKKISVDKLNNGLELHRYKLANGYKVTIVPMSGSPAVVKSYVNVGSMNETPDIKGISHFLEHMAFNGTNGNDGHIKLQQGDSFKKIDKLGGWANASTNYAITDYVNSTPLLDETKDLETQVKVIASMTEDLKLSEEMIKKEKGPVSSEINMILDEPQTIAMDQTVRTLFGIKNPADELVGGSVKHIQNLTREDVLNYYNKYYTPDNTNIVITGDVDPEKTINLVAKNFTSRKISKGTKYEEKLNLISKSARKDFYSKKATSTDIIIGFSGPNNNDTKGKILFELASAYLNSYEAGLVKKLKKKNTFPIISSEKISTNPNSPRFNFISLNTKEEDCEDALKIIFNNLGQNRTISDASLKRLKQRLKQDNDDIFEHASSVNDCIGYSVLDNDFEYLTDYDKILDTITSEEVENAIHKYFDISKAAITVIHPETEQINNSISFKANERTPINMNEVSKYKLNNNYEAAFYNTKSNNINVSLKLFNDIPYTKKAGVAQVLNEIYKNGIKNTTYDAFEEFKEKNNMDIVASAGQGGIGILFSGDQSNLQTGLKTVQQLLFNPNISDESVKTAINKIKNQISKTKYSSNFIQKQFDNAINPYSFTRKEIINSLNSVTAQDVKDLHNYILQNSRGIVTANIPIKDEKNIKNNILNSVNSLPQVKENKFKPLNIYHKVTEQLVFTIENHNSQADISEAFRFKYNNSIKEKAIAPIMNSILSNSSIGLFDVLREKENLAYSVHSDISCNENQGKITLNILTTTDNKDIGEIKYSNLQKSINGFNRQIKELTNGKFTEEDLENAKRSFKASLLNNEGNYAKIISLESGLDSPYDIDLKNKIYSEIDNITKQDIINFANYVFSQNPVYAITATADTINANREFLMSLKNKT